MDKVDYGNVLSKNQYHKKTLPVVICARNSFILKKTMTVTGQYRWARKKWKKKKEFISESLVAAMAHIFFGEKNGKK